MEAIPRACSSIAFVLDILDYIPDALHRNLREKVFAVIDAATSPDQLGFAGGLESMKLFNRLYLWDTDFKDCTYQLTTRLLAAVTGLIETNDDVLGILDKTTRDFIIPVLESFCEPAPGTPSDTVRDAIANGHPIIWDHELTPDTISALENYLTTVIPGARSIATRE